jgi:hypothetical protein
VRDFEACDIAPASGELCRRAVFGLTLFERRLALVRALIMRPLLVLERAFEGLTSQDMQGLRASRNIITAACPAAV